MAPAPPTSATPDAVRLVAVPVVTAAGEPEKELTPSSCIWFQLETVTGATVGGAEQLPAHEVEAIPTLILTAGWETILEGRERAILERTVLPQFIARQRWFGAKSRTLETVSIRDWIIFPSDGPPTAIVYVRTYDNLGHYEKYQLPMTVVTGPLAEQVLQNNSAAIIAHIKSNDGEGLLCDAVQSDDLCIKLLDLIAGAREVKTRQGRLVGQATPTYHAEPAPENRALRRGTGESSNSNVVFDDKLWLKVHRRLIDGPSVDVEVGRFLTEKAGFSRVPKTLGALEFRRPKSEPMTVGLLREWVANQGQAWELMVEVLGRYLEEVQGEAHRLDKIDLDLGPVFALSEKEVPKDVHEVIGSGLLMARTLGRRTGELHLALASDPNDPAFAPEPLTSEELSRLSDELRSRLLTGLVALKDQLDTLPADVRKLAEEVLAARPRLLEMVAYKPGPEDGRIKIRVHGDYHLGQLLWAENDFYILDFEGEPGRTTEERRAKQSPLKDVAGMLRSFDYAADGALHKAGLVHPDELERMAPWTRIWRAWMSAEFLKAYREAASSLLPTDPAETGALLDLLRLDKALFELTYEMDYRPDWVRIPLQGILHLIRSGE